MTAIHARTHSELAEYVYLLTDECRGAGAEIFDSVAVLDETAAGTVLQYDLECPDRGLEWHFTATVEPQPDWVEGGRRQHGQGAEPSQLIDAGEWFLSCSRWLAYAREVQQRPRPDGWFDPPDLQRMIDGFDLARAAVDEVLKFIPAGQDSVPESAVWTDRGREVYEDMPATFTREQLTVLRGQLAQACDFYAARSGQ